MARSVLVTGAAVVNGILLRQRKVSRLYLYDSRRRFVGFRGVSMASVCHVGGRRILGTSNLVLEVE